MQIWKYKIEMGVNDIEMPNGAEVLCVQEQYGLPHVWVLVNPKSPINIKRLVVYGTGHPINPLVSKGHYIGTFQMNQGILVWHLFDETLHERLERGKTRWTTSSKKDPRFNMRGAASGGVVAAESDIDEAVEAKAAELGCDPPDDIDTTASKD